MTEGHGHADHRSHQAMGPGSEFDTIRLLMERWGDVAVDIGDDAALLSSVGTRQRVVSVDACVEGVHFLRGWLSAREVGVRGAAAALSDLAAMGARADAVLVALGVPESWRGELGDLAEGIAQSVRASGARIVGGNLSKSLQFAMTITAIGSAERVVARRGARPGDVLVVTGRLGGPGQAVRAWLQGGAPSTWARDRFCAPVARLPEGEALAAFGARAMLDISDGLAADARHMAAASGVHLHIDARRVPVGEGISPRDALVSGEEYELLAAIPSIAARELLDAWRQRFLVPLTAIGTVGDEAPEAAVHITFADEPDSSSTNSTPRVEKWSGHDHFSS